MKRRIYLPLIALLFLTALSAQAFGPARQAAGPAPDLGRDLTVKLALPLFDDRFAEAPVASAGGKTILLKELTPQLTPTTKFLFWERQAGAEKLSSQFKQALDNRISQERIDPKLVRVYADPHIGKGPDPPTAAAALFRPVRHDAGGAGQRRTGDRGRVRA